MFASKALPDRFPYRVGQVRLAYEGTLGGEPTVEDPRPFDPCMNNEPNPIIVEFRQLHEATGNPLHADTLLFSSELMEEWDKHNREHWDHAMKVFTRLIGWTKA